MRSNLSPILFLRYVALLSYFFFNSHLSQPYNCAEGTACTDEATVVNADSGLGIFPDNHFKLRFDISSAVGGVLNWCGLCKGSRSRYEIVLVL